MTCHILALTILDEKNSKAAANKSIAAIQADGSAINISLLIFFSFGLTVLQSKF